MPEKRYQAMMAQLHAGDELINRVLQAGKPRRTPLRLAFAAACALMLIVSAAFFLKPPPKDIIAASSKNTVTEDLQPLKSPSPNDPTLSVSHVTLKDEHTLTFILTLRGEKVDKHTMISYAIEQFIFDRCAVSIADDLIPPAENERSFLFTLEYKSGPILEQLDDRYRLILSGYTAASQKQEYTLTPDWSHMDYAFQQDGKPLHPLTGEALYPLENVFAVTGFGLTKDMELIVEVRWTESAGFDTQCIPRLYDAAAGTSYPLREARHCYAGEYSYYQYTFRVHRDQLPGLTLTLETNRTGEMLEGSWPFIVDLTHLTAE